MKRFLVCLLLILTAAPAVAGWYPVVGTNLYVNGVDNYYYTRTCDRCGSYGYTRAYPIPHAQTPAAEKATPYSPGWRDAYIQTLERMNDKAAYDAAIARLPLPPAQPQTVQQQNYLRPGLHVSSIYQSTQYGYPSVNQINREPERIKYQELLATFGSSAAQNQQAGNQIVQEFGAALATNAAAQSANDAELLRAQVSIAGIVAVQNSPRKTTTKIDAKQDQSSTGSDIPPLVPESAKGAARSGPAPEVTAMLNITDASCASCHSGPTPAKKFDIRKRLTAENEQDFQDNANLIWKMVSSGAMPIDKAGAAHPLAAAKQAQVKSGLIGLGAQLTEAEAE